MDANIDLGTATVDRLLAEGPVPLRVALGQAGVAVTVFCAMRWARNGIRCRNGTTLYLEAIKGDAGRWYTTAAAVRRFLAARLEATRQRPGQQSVRTPRSPESRYLDSLGLSPEATAWANRTRAARQRVRKALADERRRDRGAGREELGVARPTHDRSAPAE